MKNKNINFLFTLIYNEKNSFCSNLRTGGSLHTKDQNRRKKIPSLKPHFRSKNFSKKVGPKTRFLVFEIFNYTEFVIQEIIF